MNDNVNFRSFKEGDYETCCEWWKWWWKRNGLNPVKRAFLPKDERCFIIEKDGVPIACYFLFIMEPYTVGWATYLISNPEYKEKDRRDLIKLLIQSPSKHMSDIHDSLDWIMIPVRHEGFKYLKNNFRKQ
jgi:hypothetical protein